MKTALRAILCPVLALILLPLASAQPPAEARSYKSGYSSIMKLGRDLYSSLSPEQREFVSPQPISIETDNTPFIRLLYFADEKEPVRGVWISAGFIDLINRIAHAEAIDEKHPGYFPRYMEILAADPGRTRVPPLPDLDNPAFWTDAVLNEQLSNFNSIVGVIVGLKLAHHHLGQYEKYKAKLSDRNGKPVPINNLLAPEEWKIAFTAGAQNALKAGCLMEGAVPFFEAFTKMKTRPAWVQWFVPRNSDSDWIQREMQSLQRKFIAGED